MELEDIYTTVQNAPRLRCSFGHRAPTIERDPIITSLECSVSRQIAALATEGTQNTTEVPATPRLKLVTVEDALKELSALNRSTSTH